MALSFVEEEEEEEEDESFCEQNPGQTSNESHLLFFCGITGSYDLQQPQIFSFSYPIS